MKEEHENISKHGAQGGLESPLSLSPFFDPDKEIEMHVHRLPHWQQGEVFYFVTWRLADSLSQEKLKQLREEKENWLRLHPEPWDEETEEEYHRQFSDRIDQWLDAGEGSCVLRDPALAKIVAGAFQFFDGKRYDLVAFVVMPNHVHVLFRLRAPHRLEEVIKSWKGFTAREINKRLGKRGELWQEGYWDRMIRNERHFFKCREYILKNPKRAKLRAGEYILWEREEESGLSSPLE
jgi:type I restriction enzyme R subunit